MSAIVIQYPHCYSKVSWIEAILYKYQSIEVRYSDIFSQAVTVKVGSLNLVHKTKILNRHAYLRSKSQQKMDS